MERKQTRPGDRRKLRTAIEMVRSRLNALRFREVTDRDARIARRQLAALSWLLELAGWPPSRYSEVSGPMKLKPHVKPVMENVPKCECGQPLPQHLASLGLTGHVCRCWRRYKVVDAEFIPDGLEPNPFAV